MPKDYKKIWDDYNKKDEARIAAKIKREKEIANLNSLLEEARAFQEKRISDKNAGIAPVRYDVYRYAMGLSKKLRGDFDA